jgi:hypothetical protein
MELFGKEDAVDCWRQSVAQLIGKPLLKSFVQRGATDSRRKVQQINRVHAISRGLGLFIPRGARRVDAHGRYLRQVAPDGGQGGRREALSSNCGTGQDQEQRVGGQRDVTERR